MKALTKGQYEGIGRALNEMLTETLATEFGDSTNIAYLAQKLAVSKLYRLFKDNDPNFKGELWLSQCGVTE